MSKYLIFLGLLSLGTMSCERRLDTPQALLDSIDADIIFDSNQSGTFGIYKLDKDTLLPVALYDTKRHEITPDASPDGKWIVFASGNSPRKEDRFAIAMVDRNGDNVKVLSRDGAYPSFDTDGDRVLYEKKNTFVIAHDLVTGKEEILFSAKEGELAGHQIFLPRLSPDETKLAITSTYGEKYSNYLVDLKTRQITHIGKGCQPIWSNDGNRIYWVTDKDKDHVTGLMLYDVITGTNQEFLDTPEPRGIDYFPYVSENESLLLYAIAKKRRHYLKGDYQIHLKDRKTGKVFQLTNDEHNHRWPRFLPRE